METGSDHAVIEWGVQFRRGVSMERPAFDWDITKLMKDADQLRKVKDEWLGRMGRLPYLDSTSSVQDLERQAEAIQQAAVQALDRHAMKVRICAMSKRWWNEDIDSVRKTVARTRRRWLSCRTSENWECYRKSRNALVAAIRKARKEHWEAFLGAAQGEELWTVLRRTRPSRTLAIPALVGPDGRVADTAKQKARARVLADISFPPPAEYHGDEGARGPEGTTHMTVGREPGMVERALLSQKTRKAPGPDRLGAPVLRLL